MLLEDTILKLFALVDSVVELYLGTFIKPFLSIHEKFYTALNTTLRKVLEDHRGNIPDWCTANFITYARTVLVVPTLLFLAWDYQFVPSILVLVVDFGDFLDGVVARFWMDIRKEIDDALSSKEKATASPPTSDDDESYQVVTTGSPQTLPSWLVLHRNRTYGGFVDAVCDKAFVIPCWISLLHIVPQSNHLRWLQYTVLLFLILAEVASGCIRFRAYFTSVAVPAPKVEGFDFSTSAVKADHIGKAKQTFEMVGTALFILPWMIHYLGLFFLTLAVPLAYESVRRKIHKRVLYVNASSQNKSNTNLDYTTLKFWMQAKAMGSKLIVGFAEENDDDDSNNKKTDMGKIFNACACSCVDEVIAEAPAKLDLMFLEKQKIDFVVSTAVETQFVTDEVVNAGRCLTIGEDGVVRLFKLKDATKKD